MTDDYPSPGQSGEQWAAPGSARPVFGAPQPSLPARPVNAPPPTPPPAPPFGAHRPSPPAPSRQSSNRRTYLIVSVIAVVALVVALLLFVGSRDTSDASASRSVDEGGTEPFGAEEPGPAEQDADSDSDSDADSDGPSFFLDPFRPDSVAIDATSVWVSDSACGVVIRIDKSTEEILGAVNVGDSASGVAVAAGSVWVGTRDSGAVVRIDPTRMEVEGSVAVPGSALGLTAQGNELWATDPLLGAVYRIDAASGQLAETVDVGIDPHHVAIGDRTVWVTNQLDNTVTMISRAGRGRSTTDVPVGSRPLHVELGGGSAWVTDSADGALRRLDENTGESQAVIDVGVWPHALAYANGAVWVGTETGTFWRIDPATNTASLVDDAGFTSIDTAVDGNNIWIADASGGTVIRFDAGAGAIGSVIDLNELGDCQTFRDEAANPQPPPDISL